MSTSAISKIMRDHSGIKSLSKIKSPTVRSARWILRLSCYQFEIVCSPGKQNVLADALSRFRCNHRGTDANSHSGFPFLCLKLISLSCKTITSFVNQSKKFQKRADYPAHRTRTLSYILNSDFIERFGDDRTHSLPVEAKSIWPDLLVETHELT